MACLMVIVLHVKLFSVKDGQVRDTVLMVQTLASIAVGSFFLMSGFFIPNQSSVPRVWKSFLRNTALPALLVVLAVNILGPWLDDEAGFWEGIMAFDLPDFAERLMRAIIGLDVSFLGNGCAHLWFIMSYALIMIWAPAIMLFAHHDGKRLLMFYAALALFRLCIIDITKMTGIPVVIYLVELGPVEVLYFVLGYLIYTFRDRLAKAGWTAPVFGALAVIWFALVFLVQRTYYVFLMDQGRDVFDVNISGAYYTSWASFCAMVSACLVALFVLSLDIKGERLRKAIEVLGSLTFPIYLIHYPIVMKINAMGFGGALEKLFHAETAVGAVIYTGFYTLLVFLVTGGLILSFRSIRKVLAHKRIIPINK